LLRSATGILVREGSLAVEDGALVEAAKVEVGSPGASSVQVVGLNAATGTRSTLDSSQGFGGGLFIGSPTGSGALVIDQGALVHFVSARIGGDPSASAGKVDILGLGGSPTSTLQVDQNLDAGAFGPSTITLSGGRLEVGGQLTVFANGVIQGNGTLSAPNRLKNGGTISPGLSPGRITIEGNYEQAAEGRLLIELGGTNSADYDHLIITNAATLDGNVTFKPINGFAPKTGDRFDFLEVGGQLGGAFASVGLQNLAPGFQFNLVANGTRLSMMASNDAVFSAALPGQVDVIVTNIGGITYAICMATTSNTCQSITLAGRFTRTNNAFNQAVQGTTFVRDDCVAAATTLTNTLLLGALPRGDYSFTISSVGQVANSVLFTVPVDRGSTFFAPTHLADGSLQFQINGLAPIRYTIEASTDLVKWVRIGNGTLPDTFKDPDAVIYPARYYRALIGP
jgi:hypothetical protein